VNRPLVDRLVDALLYEGYLLYPYRPSVKNRQRWSFGGLYPPSYTAGRVGSDASAIRTQCLVTGNAETVLTVSVRFLHLVTRLVGELDRSEDQWPIDESTTVRFVESLQVGNTRIHPWQEAIERSVPDEQVTLGDLASNPRHVEFDYDPRSEREPIREPNGAIVGFFERQQRRVSGLVEISAEPIGVGVYKVTVGVESRTAFVTATPYDRDELLLHTLVSTHTILDVRDGAFVSLLDPPEPLRELAVGCKNVGTWPVMMGTQGEGNTMLSSPIILYDYPQIAPESPGELFDSTEIDEILSLRIMTLSDEEKRTMAALDDRGRAILERVESMARGELMGLHGTFRDLRLASGGPDHGQLG
jgi:hypothetical protein